MSNLEHLANLDQLIEDIENEKHRYISESSDPTAVAALAAVVRQLKVARKTYGDWLGY